MSRAWHTPSLPTSAWPIYCRCRRRRWTTARHPHRRRTRARLGVWPRPSTLGIRAATRSESSCSSVATLAFVLTSGYGLCLLSVVLLSPLLITPFLLAETHRHTRRHRGSRLFWRDLRQHHGVDGARCVAGRPGGGGHGPVVCAPERQQQLAAPAVRPRACRRRPRHCPPCRLSRSHERRPLESRRRRCRRLGRTRRGVAQARRDTVFGHHGRCRRRRRARPA